MLLTDKPLAPENVIVNITKEGYYITWKYTDVPGRPSVDKFIVEYREANYSSTWMVADAAVPAKRRIYLFSTGMAKAEKTYDFRVFSYGANEFSDAAYVTVRYEIGELQSYLLIIVYIPYTLTGNLCLIVYFFFVTSFSSLRRALRQ